MGMYDDIRIDPAIVLPGYPKGHTQDFQTKNLNCALDTYEVRADGTLWHEEYDTVDRSDPTAEGIMRIAGMAARINPRWVQVTNFTGEIEIHDWIREENLSLEYSFYFVDGHLVSGPNPLRMEV